MSSDEDEVIVHKPEGEEDLTELRNPNRQPQSDRERSRPPTEEEARQAERDRVQKRRSHESHTEKHHEKHQASNPRKSPQHQHKKESRPDSRSPGRGVTPTTAASPSAPAPAPTSTFVPAAPEELVTSLLKDRDVVPYHKGSRPNIEDGIRSGKIVVGKIKVLKWTTGIAFVICPGLGVDIDVHTVEARSGAMPDDIVAVELTDESLWEERVGFSAGGALDDDDANTGVLPTDSPSTTPTTMSPALSPAQSPSTAMPVIRSAPNAPGAQLPDGREIRHVVDDTEIMATRKHAAVDPVVAIYQMLDAKPPKESIPADKKPRGRVVAVLESRFRHMHPSRVLEDASNGLDRRVQPGRFYKFRTYDQRFPYLAVFGKDIPSQFHDKLRDILPLIRIMTKTDGTPLAWVDDRFPRGEMLISLGQSGTTEAETRAIAAANNVKDSEFTDEVLECVFQEFKVPPADKLKEQGRTDLRETEFVCTIDPATARDLDDALSITKTPGGYRVGVHIADVSFFVPINTALDLEARDRCTSTYFVERVIPMLPRKLCEDYCSLNAGEDKFAFSCIFNVDNNGKITSEWFGQSVIRNRCRMAYEDAQRIIEGDLSGDSLQIHEVELQADHVTRDQLVRKVVASTQMLFELASKMREAQIERGGLSLNKSKLKFQFDEMNSKVAPMGFGLERSKEANWMVEQFMLLANIRVAEKIVEWLPDRALIRKHDRPDRKKLKAFSTAAAKHGYKIVTSTSKALNESLQRYNSDPNSDALRLMGTYSMMLAKYISSGESGDDPENTFMGHYALATAFYTHFTSPIRRYADLMVHRQLLLALDIEKIAKQEKIARGGDDANFKVPVDQCEHHQYFMPHSEVAEIALKCNTRKENARKCSDMSLKMFFCLYLEAIRLRATIDPTIPAFQRTQVQIVRQKENTFTVYSSEIAADCEIFLNAKTQLWKGDCKTNPTDKTFSINWGPAPSGGEDVIETAGLFFKCTAQLRVCHENGLMKLDMILEPPWLRSAASVMSTIPKHLDD